MAINPQSNSIALNAAAFTAIVTVGSEHSTVGRDIAVQTSDGSAWVFSDDAAGTVPLTIPAPGSMSYQCRQDTAGVLFYAKASAGTPTLTVLIGVCRK